MKELSPNTKVKFQLYNKQTGNLKKEFQENNQLFSLNQKLLLKMKNGSLNKVNLILELLSCLKKLTD